MVFEMSELVFPKFVIDYYFKIHIDKKIIVLKGQFLIIF